MRHRYRWFYHLTGLPGWVRFGYSPGWLGRSPSGLGPAAHYFHYGEWPTSSMNSLWQSGRVPFTPSTGFSRPGYPTPYDPWGVTPLTPEEELDYLKTEAKLLAEELSSITQRIAELEQREKEGEEK